MSRKPAPVLYSKPRPRRKPKTGQKPAPNKRRRRGSSEAEPKTKDKSKLAKLWNKYGRRNRKVRHIRGTGYKK